MQTRCPYPECGHEFEIDYTVPENDWHWPTGTCPRCNLPATLRPIEVWQAMEHSHALRVSRNGLSGGSESPYAPRAVSVVLEDVRSLWNVGAIFRTSDGAGVHQLFLCGVTGCPPRKEISKTSLGAENTIPWEYSTSAVPVLRKMHEQRLLIVGLERSEGSASLYGSRAQSLIRAPMALIVGNEVNGLSAESRNLCDLLVYIPMRGTKESLNVAVAFGVAIYSMFQMCGLPAKS